MNFVDESFENERIELHGKSFRGCKFTNCELVYDGDRSPTFSNNKFVDTVFVFTLRLIPPGYDQQCAVQWSSLHGHALHHREYH